MNIQQNTNFSALYISLLHVGYDIAGKKYIHCIIISLEMKNFETFLSCIHLKFNAVKMHVHLMNVAPAKPHKTNDYMYYHIHPFILHVLSNFVHILLLF